MAERLKKAAGTKVVEEGLEPALPEAAKKERPLRPSQYRAYMQREIAREFRGIVQSFVEGAKSGSCQHMKLATELMEWQPSRRRRRKTAVQDLLEEMQQRDPMTGERRG